MNKLLNLGCGKRFHKDWINIDIQSQSEYVIAHDLKKGIPYNDNEFDMVYHSHVLEHIPKNEAYNFLQECVRVLKPGGVLRIAIPDLEKITRKYLELLEKGIENPLSQENWENYQWLLIEMYDQTVRTQSGGEMRQYLTRKNIINEAFLIEQCGFEVKEIWESLRQNRTVEKVGIAKKLFWFFKYSQFRNDAFHQLLFPKRHRLYLSARFRNSGEIHQWMYDRYSLGKLLSELKLTSITTQKFDTSHNSSWNSFELDGTKNNGPFKPDSLFVEGIK